MPATEDPERAVENGAVENGCFKKVYGILTCQMTLTLAIFMGISYLKIINEFPKKKDKWLVGVA